MLMFWINFFLVLLHTVGCNLNCFLVFHNLLFISLMLIYFMCYHMPLLVIICLLLYVIIWCLARVDYNNYIVSICIFKYIIQYVFTDVGTLSNIFISLNVSSKLENVFITWKRALSPLFIHVLHIPSSALIGLSSLQSHVSQIIFYVVWCIALIFSEKN